MYYNLTLPQQVFCEITGWHSDPLLQKQKEDGEEHEYPPLEWTEDIKHLSVCWYAEQLRNAMLMPHLQWNSITTQKPNEMGAVIKAIDEFMAIYGKEIPPCNDSKALEILHSLDNPEFRKAVNSQQAKLESEGALLCTTN